MSPLASSIDCLYLNVNDYKIRIIDYDSIDLPKIDEKTQPFSSQKDQNQPHSIRGEVV